MKSVFTIVTSRSHDGDINEWYKINPVEVLGSGQFGTVYGGHSLKTKEHVAIKVIDKTRFSDQEEKIHHEVDILHEITHPGIIRLHAMFDTPEKVGILLSRDLLIVTRALQFYLVMEKLHSDMLEMILSQPNKRLNERQTKFLIYQVEGGRRGRKSLRSCCIRVDSRRSTLLAQ